MVIARKLYSKTTCPHCGNNDQKFIQSNGAADSSVHLTLLCVARVKEWCFDHVKPEPHDYDANGLVPCAMQWDPNDE